MSSSTDGPAPSVATEVPVPGALSSMWRLFRLGYTHEPGLLVFAVAVTVVSAVPDALIALLLKVLADAVQDGSGARAAYAMGGLAVAVTFNWLLTVVQSRMTRRFRDKVTIALEGHVARLQASIETIAHHERADYLDRLAVLRNQIFVLDHMYLSVLSTLSWLVRLTITLALLASISPMLLLLALFAIPTVLSSSWRPTQERAVEEAAAVHQRLADHLFQTATTASAGKEVRVTGIGPWLVGARRAEWELWYGPVHRARAATALWHALAWTVFGAGFVGAVWFVAVHLHRSSGDVLLILMAGSRLSAYVASTVSEIGFLRGVWLYGAQRLAWLEDYAEALRAAGDLEAPSSLAQGIELRDVTFTYPGSDRPALDHVTLTLPAGAVVAIVGENGAGKSTLVKLLAKFYEPESGEILLDGRPLRRIRTESWRARMSGAFQDFHRFEFAARTSVGLGDLPQLDDGDAVSSAAAKAGASDVVLQLPLGLDTQLGPVWPGGVDVSFGQWQKLALARGFMRASPLLLVLDEPTAALDAETEHDLFERYAASAADRAPGGITVLVSHRFSTVRMADLIVVLDGSGVAEVGSHEELMRRGGPYSELYAIQQQAYR